MHSKKKKHDRKASSLNPQVSPCRATHMPRCRCHGSSTQAHTHPQLSLQTLHAPFVPLVLAE